MSEGTDGRSGGRGRGKGRGGKGRGGGRGRGRGRGGQGQGGQQRGDAAAEATSSSSASDLLNFRLPAHSDGDGGNSSRGGRGGGGGGRGGQQQRGGQRKESQKQREKREASERAERKARRNQGDAFFLRTSAVHGFVLARRARDKQQKGGGQGQAVDASGGTGGSYTFSGPDEPLNWDAVRSVRCLVELHSHSDCSGDSRTLDDLSSSAAVCPICLDAHVAPRVTPCGHAFCLPCVLRHLYGDDMSTPNAPMQPPRSPAAAPRAAPAPAAPTGYAGAAAAASAAAAAARRGRGGAENARSAIPSRPPVAFPPLSSSLLTPLSSSSSSAATKAPRPTAATAAASAAAASAAAWGASTRRSAAPAPATPVAAAAPLLPQRSVATNPTSPQQSSRAAPSISATTTTASVSATSTIPSPRVTAKNREAKCPCCSVSISSEALRPVKFVSVRSPRPNPSGKKEGGTTMTLEFTKLHRPKGCHAPYLPLPGLSVKFAGPNALPSASGGTTVGNDNIVDEEEEAAIVSSSTASASRFCRFNYCDPASHSGHLSSDAETLRRRAVELRHEAEAFGHLAGSALEVGFVHMAISAVEEEARLYSTEGALYDEAYKKEDEALVLAGGGRSSSGMCRLVDEMLRYDPNDERRRLLKSSGASTSPSEQRGIIRGEEAAESNGEQDSAPPPAASTVAVGGASAWDYDEDSAEDKGEQSELSAADADIAQEEKNPTPESAEEEETAAEGGTAATAVDAEPSGPQKKSSRDEPIVEGEGRQQSELSAAATHFVPALADEAQNVEKTNVPPSELTNEEAGMEGTVTGRSSSLDVDAKSDGQRELEEEASGPSSAGGGVGQDAAGQTEDRGRQQRRTRGQQKKKQRRLPKPGPASMYLEHDGSYCFYQSSDGQLAFLSPFNVNCLNEEFSLHDPHHVFAAASSETNAAEGSGGGSDDADAGEEEWLRLRRAQPLPDAVKGKVVDVERVHLTPALRKRFPFLSHLPLYSDVNFVELDLHGMLSETTRDKFREEGRRRERRRRDALQSERKTDRATRAKEQNQIAKVRARAREFTVDPEDAFFRSGGSALGSAEEYDPEGFGPSLAGESGEGGEGGGAVLAAAAVSSPSSPGAPSWGGRAAAAAAASGTFSFSTICAEGGAFPTLGSPSAAAVEASPSPRAQRKKTAAPRGMGASPSLSRKGAPPPGPVFGKTRKSKSGAKGGGSGKKKGGGSKKAVVLSLSSHGS